MSDDVLIRITDACINECIRQGATRVYDVMNMLDGYRRVMNADPMTRITTDLFRHLAYIVEPEHNKRPEYRVTPVVFAQRNHPEAPSYKQIPRLMTTVFDLWNTGEMHVDLFIQEILRIHPMNDGNGRTAFILRNYLMNTLEFPEPLPDYFNPSYQAPRMM